MSGFTPDFKHEVEFDGDKVTFVLRRLKRSHMQVLAPYIKTGADGDMKLTFPETMELMGAAAQVLPDVVKSMEGLTIQGRPATLEEILDETYFMNFLGEVMGVLIQNSTTRAEDEKNSAELSPVGRSEPEPAT